MVVEARQMMKQVVAVGAKVAETWL